MKRNKVFKHFLIIIILFFISIFFEWCFVHYKRLSVSDSGKYVLSKKYVDKEINVSLNKRYVDKLQIYYQTDEDVTFTLSYVSYDEYNNVKNNTVEEIFDNEINVQVIPIKNKVGDIKIISDDIDKIKFKNIVVDNTIRFNYFVCGFIFGILVLIYVLYCCFRYGVSIDGIYKYFMIIGFVLGALIIYLQPSATYFSWDDSIHFTNTYELLGGNFDWKIGEYSMVYVDPVGRDSISGIDEQEIQKKYFNQNSLSGYHSYGGRFVSYNRIFYIIPAIGFYGSRLLHLPFSICFKMGKVMILLFYLVAMGYAIKSIKVGKSLLSVVALMPSVIFLATQYSYDVAVIVGITLSFVQLINWYLDDKCLVDFKSMLLFLCSILLASFVKSIYIPFILLFMFVPKKKFKNQNMSKYIKFLLIVLMIMVMYTFIMPTVSNSAVGGDARGGNTSVSAQMSLIFKYPFGYFKILYNNMIGNFFEYLLGSSALINFAYMNFLNGNMYYLYFILLLFVTFTESNNYRFSLFYRIVILIMCLGIMSLIWTAMYVAFTPVGLTTINGVQPRYFIPFLFPILFSFIRNNKVNFKEKSSFRFLIFFGIPALVMMVTIYKLILIRYCF